VTKACLLTDVNGQRPQSQEFGRVTYISSRIVTTLGFTALLWSILSGCSQTPSQPAPLPPQGAKAVIDPRNCKKPEWPVEWSPYHDLREPYVVKMRFHVDANGHATGAEVVRSGGSKRLDQATIDALIICKFKPALENGTPIEGYAEIEYIWKFH